METVAVTFYNVVVWLHVSSVVIAFGPTFAFGIYFAVAGRKYPRALPAIREATITINRSMVTLGGDPDPDHRALPRLARAVVVRRLLRRLGPVAIIVLLGLVHGFFLPNDQRGLQVSKRDIEAAGPTGDVKFSEEHEELTGRNARMGPVAGLIVILTIYVMAAKPFL